MSLLALRGDALLLSGGGGAWGALTTYPLKLSPQNLFLVLGVHLHPLNPLATHMGLKIRTRNCFSFSSRNDTHAAVSSSFLLKRER